MKLTLFYMTLITLLAFGGVASAAGEFKQGRYFGWIELNSTQDRIAVVTDFYLESPDDLKLFPALHASLKLTLGGHQTHEYVTETFENVHYDFDNGILTLDNPKNDVSITAEVRTVNGNPQLVGDVFFRSSALFGKLFLIYETDEPEDGGPATLSSDSNSFLPLLDGQYEGDCQGTRAVLQLQTIRGLKTVWQTDTETTSLSRYYGISGRLGVKDPIVCGSNQRWCTYYTYGGGSYNPYTGQLQLTGPSATDDCTVVRDTLTCRIRRTGWNPDCTLKKVASKIKAPKFFTRGFNLSGSNEQLKPLPAAEPPTNSALANAVRGTFTGFLHNEHNNAYQYFQLSVMPFSFTENPHNPNQIMITSTASLHLGNDAAAPFLTQRYEPRSFYVRPGFTLSGPNTDTFINISEWKMGFIRGVLYSRAFGRVGTVQLIKGKAPSAPASLDTVRSFVGEFTGPQFPAGEGSSISRWFRFLFPVQPNDMSESIIRFTGSYSHLVEITPVRSIERGSFDPFTGVFGWIIEKEGAATFANGFVGPDHHIQMYWPPAPGVFGTHMSDYVNESYLRK